MVMYCVYVEIDGLFVCCRSADLLKRRKQQEEAGQLVMLV